VRYMRARAIAFKTIVNDDIYALQSSPFESVHIVTCKNIRDATI
jgi:hypothetical protein